MYEAHIVRLTLLWNDTLREEPIYVSLHRSFAFGVWPEEAKRDVRERWERLFNGSAGIEVVVLDVELLESMDTWPDDGNWHTS